MSSLNHCIKFELDVKDENIVFKDYFYKSIKLQKHKIYEAELLQPACPFCGSLDLLHNGHLITNIHYPIAIASLPVIIRLAKQRVKCRTCERWSMAQSELVKVFRHGIGRNSKISFVITFSYIIFFIGIYI